MSEEIKQQEAATIIAAREALGMTRAELAGRLGIGQSTLRNAENGRFRLGARTYQRMQDLLARSKPSKPNTPEMAEPSSPYQSHPSNSGIVSNETIAQVLAAANNAKVQHAAKALADALAIPIDDALCKVIAEKLGS